MRPGIVTGLLAYAFASWCSVCLVLLPRQVTGVDFCTEQPVKHNLTQRHYLIATVFDTNNAASRQATRLTLEFINSSLNEMFDPPMFMDILSLDNSNSLAKVRPPAKMILWCEIYCFRGVKIVTHIHGVRGMLLSPHLQIRGVKYATNQVKYVQVRGQIGIICSLHVYIH